MSTQIYSELDRKRECLRLRYLRRKLDRLEKQIGKKYTDLGRKVHESVGKKSEEIGSLVDRAVRIKREIRKIHKLLK